MDKKSIGIIVVCLLLLFAWGPIVNLFYPPVPAPPSAKTVAGATNQLASGTNQSVVRSGTNAQPAAAGTTGSFAATQDFEVDWNAREELISVTNDNLIYNFTSRGGGIKDIKLRYPPKTESSGKGGTSTNSVVETLNTASGPPIFAVVGDKSLQDDGVYLLTPMPKGVKAEKTLANGLTLTKEFEVGTNYLVNVSLKLANNNKSALSIPGRELIIGTATPMNAQDNGMALTAMWYNGTKTAQAAVTWFNTNTSMLFVIPRTPTTEYREGSNNVVWASVQNQFFALATMPAKPASSIVVDKVDLPPPGMDDVMSNPRTVLKPVGLQTALYYPGEILAPGQAVTNQFDLFTGPKEYKTLVSVNDRFNNNIDQVMGFSGWFGPISKMLLASMNWLHNALGLNYGLIIILITVIIKMIFWPLTRASTRSMKRMQELAPQMKALQAKYKDEPQKLSQKQWEFWKKNKVNPLGGCLPMFLQIPVFFGFFGMLRNAIELRGTPFLWIKDLSQPDTVLIIPIMGHLIPLNPMPLIMGASQFWQASMTPPSPGMDPAQQKMMKYMPLVMVVFLYNYSAGLALYWTVSNLLTILQTRLTKTTPVTTTAAPAPVAVAPQKKKNN